MPNDYYSLRDGYRPGVISPVEEAQQRQMLANQKIQAQAQIEALRQGGETSRMGTYGQRNAGDMAMMNLHGSQNLASIGAQGDQSVRAIAAGQAPQMLAQQREDALTQEGAAERAATHAAKVRELGFDASIDDATSPIILDTLRNYGRPRSAAGPSAPAGMSGGLPSAGDATGISQMFGAPAASAPSSAGMGGDPDAMNIAMGMIAARHGGKFPDIEALKMQRQRDALVFQDEQQSRATKKAMAQRAGGQNAAAAQTEAGADIPTTLPTLNDFMGSKEGVGIGADASALSDAFAEKDAGSFFGRDPGEADVQTIINERDRAARVLVAKGYDPAQAKQEVNRKILMSPKVLAHKDDVNAGWIQTLIQRLNGGAAPAGNAGPGAAMQAGKWLGERL